MDVDPKYTLIEINSLIWFMKPLGSHVLMMVWQ